MSAKVLVRPLQLAEVSIGGAYNPPTFADAQ